MSMNTVQAVGDSNPITPTIYTVRSISSLRFPCLLRCVLRTPYRRLFPDAHCRVRAGLDGTYRALK